MIRQKAVWDHSILIINLQNNSEKINMISELNIKNFRSIRSASVNLMPLTVIIGANGSGKSNLVKAIEFIAAIPAVGLNIALSRQGGREGVMPKKIPLRELSEHQVHIGYKKRLPPPGGSNEHISYVNVSHSFSFSFKSASRVSIGNENLNFDKVLYIGETLRDKNLRPKIDESSLAHPSKHSYFELSNISGRNFYKAEPPISEETFANFRSWLGLGRFSTAIKDSKTLGKFLEASQRLLKNERSHTTTSGPKTSRGIYTDRSTKTICDFSEEFKIFLDYLEATKRYDLLLNELRREQAPSESPDLSTAGQNLPAALRKLSTTNKPAFSRLKSTFEAIAPHILTMRSKELRTGSEFVEFFESKSGRGIESWETSDGSLRALAILVAVETAQMGETIIVEEPEQNLHPWAIRVLIDHIRNVITENSIQVIMTTHSEHVLERAAPDEVLVASRSLDEGTSYKRVTEIVKKGNVAMGEVGRLWVKGLLGGVPTVQ